MTEVATQTEQLPLFAELGVEAAPVGLADLTTREQRFVLAYLRTGLASTAAREAGYSDPEADATKIRKRPKIAAILAQAATGAAGNANAMARRVWERSQAYHAELQQIRPQVQEQRAKGLPMPASDEDKSQRNYLDRLRFLEDREKWLLDAVSKQDQLLASLHAKIELNISGTVDHAHTHVVLTADKMAALVAARREALASHGD